VTNQEIRRKILEILYESFVEHPYNRVTPSEFKEMIKIGLKDLHFNMIYLEEKGYVELQKPLEGSVFVGARLTSKGIDLVEDEYQMAVFFPEEAAELSVPARALEELNSLIDETNKSAEFGPDLKELITEEIKEIKLELTNSQPSFSRIRDYMNRLKERNFEVYQKVVNIIKEPTVAKILSNAAKRELGI
jgi:hypothetical protein